MQILFNILPKLNHLPRKFSQLLQILKIRRIPVNSLTSLIKNTKGSLIDIEISDQNHLIAENKIIIQAIYHNCPNLKYLTLSITNANILELEKLLINCQYLNGLQILNQDLMFDWDNLF